MSWLHVFILSVVEGLTEFLPISSTGHMVLVAAAFGIAEDPFTKLFEVFIQLGAIFTIVVLYARRLRSPWSFYRRVGLAFLPTAALGYLLKDHVDQWLESPAVVVATLILGGVVLLWIDRLRPTGEGTGIEQLTDGQCLSIGLGQSFALVPGVSRSGASIVTALLMGMNKAAAAEFSFLLAVPTMAAATGYKLVRVFLHGPGLTADEGLRLAVGFLVSFIVAAVAVKTFVSYLQSHGLRLFGWYRIGLGVAILLWQVANH